MTALTISKSSTLQTSTAPNSSGVTQGDLDKKADEIVKKTQEKVDKVIEKFESRIDEKEAKTTEILAIFITLFTFISVNISVFTKTTDLLSATVFMLLMTLCSTFLVSFLFLVSSRKLPNRTTTAGLLLSLLCLSMMVLIIMFTKWNPALNVK